MKWKSLGWFLCGLILLNYAQLLDSSPFELVTNDREVDRDFPDSPTIEVEYNMTCYEQVVSANTGFGNHFTTANTSPVRYIGLNGFVIVISTDKTTAIASWTTKYTPTYGVVDTYIGPLKWIGARLCYVLTLRDTEGVTNNFRILFAYSDDNGDNWTTLISAVIDAGNGVAPPYMRDVYKIGSDYFVRFGWSLATIDGAGVYCVKVGADGGAWTRYRDATYKCLHYGYEDDTYHYYVECTTGHIRKINGAGTFSDSEALPASYWANSIAGALIKGVGNNFIILSAAAILRKEEGTWRTVQVVSGSYYCGVTTSPGTQTVTHFWLNNGTNTDIYRLYPNCGILKLQTISGSQGNGFTMNGGSYDAFMICGLGTIYAITNSTLNATCQINLKAGDSGSAMGILGSNPFTAETGIILMDNSGNKLLHGILTYSNNDGLYSFNVTDVAKQDLDRKIDNLTYTTQTVAAILTDLFARYGFYLSPATAFSSSASTYTITFNGNLRDALKWCQNREYKQIWWDEDLLVYFDSGTVDGGLTLSQASGNIASGVVQNFINQRINAILLWGRIVSGAPLRSYRIKGAATAPGYNLLVDYYAGPPDQTALDSLADQILSNLDKAFYSVNSSIAGVGMLQVGQNITITYAQGGMNITGLHVVKSVNYDASSDVCSFEAWSALAFESTQSDFIQYVSQKVDALGAAVLPLAGGTLTGNLTTIAGNLFGAFITWRDAAQWDYSTGAGTLTANGAYQTKAAVMVTDGARNIILVTYTASAASGTTLRATGATNPIVQLYYNSAFVETMHIIPLDASKQFDYMIPAGHTLYIQVVGWF